jgi:hypothetical protein
VHDTAVKKLMGLLRAGVWLMSPAHHAPELFAFSVGVDEAEVIEE